MRINLDDYKKKLKKNYRQLKTKLTKKKHQRKLIAIIALLLLVALASGLAVRDTQAVRRARTIQQKQTELRETQSTLQQIKEQKAQTEQELKSKADVEVQLKKQVEQLNKDLQTKRATQTQLANARPSIIPAKPIQAKAQPAAPLSFARRLGQGAYGPNTYTYRSCTWWAKSWRPDLPSTLGNANRWAINARALGWAVGSTPAVGAVGVTTRGAYGHVVVVTAVHGNGMISIKEGNYDYNGSVRTRSAKATEFGAYIY